MKENSENTNGALIHISYLGGYLFTLGQIITPLILWQVLKKRSPFLDKTGKEAVNFNLSYSIYTWIIIMGLMFSHVGDFFKSLKMSMQTNMSFHYEINEISDIENILDVIGFGTIYIVIKTIKLLLVIIATIKTSKGETYKYPLTIKFIN